VRTFSREKLKGPVLPPSEAPASRVRMLEQALKLFALRGFHGTSTRDLTSALEVQPSALYAHFASKEEVLAELIWLGYSTHQQALRDALLDAGAAPADQLATAVKANARFHAAYPLLAVVVHEEVHALPEKRLESVKVLRQQTIGLITQIVERGVAQKAFDVQDVATTVGAIGAMALRIPYWFEPSARLDVDGLADAQAELALRMVAAKHRSH